MDRFSFVAPARAKVVVVPVGDVLPSDFAEYFAQIRSANDIRLLDVSPIPDCHYFNPQAFPKGHVFYDFSTSIPEEDTVFLHDFEPFRKTMVLIGVGNYSTSKNDIDTLKADFPTAIVHNCILFNSPKLLKSLDSEYHYLSSLDDLSITDMETTMCAITRNYLSALDKYVDSYQNMPLRSPVSLIDGNVLTRTINSAQKRLSSSSFKISFSSTLETSKSTDQGLKAQQKTTGRLLKLMGNFFLLAGRFKDALQYFTDAAINLRKVDDYLWLASSLEGLATSSLILAYLGLPHHVQNPMLASVLQVPKNRFLALASTSSRISADSLAPRSSANIISPRNSTSSTLSFGFSASALTGTGADFSNIPLPEFLRVLCLKASQYYQLSPTHIEDCVPDVVYVESLIRTVKLLIAIYLAGSDPIESVLESVVKSTPIVLASSKDDCFVLKSEIVQEIDKVFSLQLVDLEFVEQCRIYCALASVYSDLGLYRKQAFILRILLVALLPKVNKMEEQGPIATLKSRASIKAIFELLFQVYHIDSDPERDSAVAREHMSDWSTLQLLLIKICLRIAEVLEDHDTLAKLCVLAFTRYSHCLLAEDQTKLKNKLNCSNLILANQNSEHALPYPDPFLLRGIKLVVAVSGSELIPFPENDQLNGSAQNGDLIFNPFNKSKALTNHERIVCIDEVHQLKATLQNPFPHEVQLSDITVVGDDEVKIETLSNLSVRVSSTPYASKGDYGYSSSRGLQKMEATNGEYQYASLGSVVLPLNSLSQVLISFKALNAGQLTIRGLRMKAGNSKTQLYLILESEKTSGLQKIKKIGATAPVENGSTLDKLVQNLSEPDISQRVNTKELTLNVIPRQPSLLIARNLVTTGWIMLLEGERQRFSLDLVNNSVDPINYISFSFWDSIQEVINSKLAQANVYSAEDVYELEWLLINNKPCSVLNKKEIMTQHKVISPNEGFKIDYEIVGKRGMNYLKLTLEYSNKSGAAPGYYKTVNAPLNVSIQLSLDIVGCDVIPLFSSSLDGYIANSEVESDLVQRNMTSLLKFIADIKNTPDDQISAYCLLILDVKNSWKHKLCVNICKELLPGKKYIVNEVLDPSETFRVLLPIKRIGYDVVDTSKPIPSLRNKQFVKNYSISEEEERQERKNFWVKSVLLEGLSGRWNTVGSKFERNGILDFRCIRLNTGMSNVLIYDSILIQHSIFADTEKMEEIPMKTNEYHLEREKFYILRTRIVNHTNEALGGVLRHVPYPVNPVTKQDMSIEQKILYNGVLQKNIDQDSIKQGESLEMSLGFMILEKGRYEWGCVFDVAKSKDKRVVGREPIFINAC